MSIKFNDPTENKRVGDIHNDILRLIQDRVDSFQMLLILHMNLQESLFRLILDREQHQIDVTDNESPRVIH